MTGLTSTNGHHPTPSHSAASSDEAPQSQSDKRKQSLYFPESMLEEIHGEAARLERSLSWIVQRAWKMARPEIRKLPSSRASEDDSES